MRQAFALLGVMTLLISVGAFFALSKKAEAPIVNQDTDRELPMSLTLTSPAFVEGGMIPSEYTCDGENTSPELHIANVPEGTKSLVLVMDDPDIPDSVKQAKGIEVFDHWVLYNIPSSKTVIPKGGLVGDVGLNSKGEAGYTGSCPPDREHRYFFRLYALSGTLNFIKAPTLKNVEEAAKGMMLETTTLMGRYERIAVTQ